MFSRLATRGPTIFTLKWHWSLRRFWFCNAQASRLGKHSKFPQHTPLFHHNRSYCQKRRSSMREIWEESQQICSSTVPHLVSSTLVNCYITDVRWRGKHQTVHGAKRVCIQSDAFSSSSRKETFRWPGAENRLKWEILKSEHGDRKTVFPLGQAAFIL